MKTTRRDFLKLSGASIGALVASSSVGCSLVQDIRPFPLRKPIGETASICPYCSCGCGLIAATDEQGKIINVEGDPGHPNNQGALDPKSISLQQLSQSASRLKKPLYRAPGNEKFEEKDWDWTVTEIAKRIKATRDATFERENDKGITVNRTPGIAFLGGAVNNSEECYLAVKLARALGLVNIEHQARI